MSWGPLRVAVLAGLATLAVLFGVGLGGIDLPWAAGELDLLIPARAAAAGLALPGWAASVHPDAPGTWMESLLLAPLLALGLPDLLAVKALAAAHGALLVASATWLATRLAGARAGALCAGLLLLGAPTLASTYSRLQGTTAEAATWELLLVVLAIPIAGVPALRGAFLSLVIGGAAGLAVAWSLHTILVLPTLICVIAHKGHRRRAILFTLGLVGGALPFFLFPDPLGPPRAILSIHSQSPIDILTGLGWDDAWTLLRQLPHAMSPGAPRLPGHDVRHFLAAPWGLLLLAGSIRALRSGGLPALHAATGLGLLLPLVLAPDLVGFPSAFRWVVPALPWLAVATSSALAPTLRSSTVFAAFALLLGSTGAALLPRVSQGELGRQGAVFVAAQHRLCFPKEGLFHHALRLLPWVEPEEIGPFAEGWGLHLGREYATQLPTLQIELDDAWPTLDARPPADADPFLRVTQPAFWWTPVAVLPGEAHPSFARGVGLGIAEAGLLEPADLALIAAAPPGLASALWEGVGGAMGERKTFAHDGAPPRMEGADAPQADIAAFSRGYRATAPPGSEPPPGWAAPGPPVAFALAHPFLYAYSVRARP